jgi:uncharacterized membrane protein
MASKRNPFMKPLRILRNHWRLFASIAAGLCLSYLLPTSWTLPTRILVGWDSGVILYLVIAFAEFTRFDIKRVRQRAAGEDEGALLVLVLTVAAAGASLGAIIALLGSAQEAEGQTQGADFALAVLTIFLSWCFVHVIFAFHYAHAYYGEDVEKGACLNFPGEQKPDYWDFAYFSFVIGATFQVSDVEVVGRRIRRFVLVHGILSFVFNVTIVTLAVNIGSDLIR